MTLEEIKSRSDQWEMPLYQRLPVAFARGAGVYLWDTEGTVYLDFFAGIAVNILGHGHPAMVAAVREGAELLHLSNHYYCRERALLAQRLGNLAGGKKVFFANSGTEAVEAAIKLARKWGGESRREILTSVGSFHGRTLGALAATGQPKYQRDFEPLPRGFVHVPFNDLEAARAACGPETVAILLEPIQGEGGIHPASTEYLQGVRELCDEGDMLLIFDEIQTGMGRTGSMFAYQEYGVEPDIIILAKGLGGGLPIGACLAKPQVAEAFRPGDHGTTFGGNPLSCRGALAVIAALEEGQILAQVRRVGQLLREGLEQIAQENPLVAKVRGMGLILGMELTIPARSVVEGCLAKGLVVGASDRTLRIEPPLILNEGEAAAGLEVLGKVLEEVAKVAK